MVNIANGNTGRIVTLGQKLVDMEDLNLLISKLITERTEFVG